jgi:methylated-DNA-protein-cysteine methyltransferase-like protein
MNARDHFKIRIKGDEDTQLRFFERVYDAVRSVPYGKVSTYGQIALMIGAPGAARQVGWALASLQPGTDVPWHRIINAKGRISLKSRGEGAELQRRLLEEEGVVFDERDRIDLTVFQYLPRV